jgi:hypothetical protein
MPPGFFSRGKKGKTGDDEKSDDEDFESSAFEKITTRQDEQESVLRDFIGESKRRFAQQEQEASEQKQGYASLSEKIDRLLSRGPASAGLSAARSTPPSTPGFDSSSSGPRSPDSSSELNPALAPLFDRLDRIEKLFTAKAEEEENNPVMLIIRQAGEDLNRRIAKNIAATMKATIYAIADDYSIKVKRAVAARTVAGTGSEAPPKGGKPE